jgi:SNF2 family DNA or RNA helicase
VSWQNNLKELFSLLHFVVPDFFDSMEAFTTFFDRPFASDDTGTVACLLSGSMLRLTRCSLVPSHPTRPVWQPSGRP